MKKKIFVIQCFIIVLLLSSCGLTKETIQQGIKRDFQEKMDTDENYKKYGMKVQKVALVKSGTYSYDGFVTVLLDNETRDVPISVTTDGSSYMWETKPLAFAFLVQYELEHLDLFNW